MSGIDQKKVTVIHKAGEGVVFDPRLLRSGGKETHVFTLVLTPAELSAVPTVLALTKQPATVTCTIDQLDDCLVVNMKVRAQARLLDDHDLKAKPTTLTDTADLVLSTDPDMADIMPGRDGRYDLRPSALALFYAAVPESFSTSGLDRIEGDGYEIVSEAEYAREQQAAETDRPFAAKLGKKD